MIKWLYAGFLVIALLVALAPVPTNARPDDSPTPTKTPGGPTYTPTRTRTPTATATPFPEPRPASDWMYVSQVDNGFGGAVGEAGDVNADGYDDAVISTQHWDRPPVVYLFFGSAAGLAGAPGWSFSPPDRPNLDVNARGAGDVNHDGYADVVVGSPGYGGAGENRGRAYLFYGSSEGLQSKPGWTATGEMYAAYFGQVVDAAGDVNADGYGDVIVGAWGTDSALGHGQGRAYVYCGSPEGLGPSPCWTATGEQKGSRFGDAATGGAGDVNGDGYDDVVISARRYSGGQSQEGRAYLYYGSADGLSTIAGWTTESNQVGAELGSGRPRAGDVNRDGYGDIIIGAPLYDSGAVDSGRAFLYLGGPLGPDPAASWTASGEQANAHLGAAVSGSGDLNGNGYPEIVVGVPGFDGVLADQGIALVYAGSPEGAAAAPSFRVEAVRRNTALGAAAGEAGDVNGDGVADLLIGAPGYDTNEANTGAAFIYLGAPDAPSATSTPTATASATLTPTSAPTQTATLTSTPAETGTPSVTPSPTPSVYPDTPAPPSRLYLPLVVTRG